MAPAERMQQQNFAREDAAAKELGGLLAEKWQPGNQDAMIGPWAQGDPMLAQGLQQRQGGFRQASGLLGAMPDSATYLEAATRIPALTNTLVSTAQQQQAAMDRQVQEQTYRQHNMSAAELANYTLATETQRINTANQDRNFGVNVAQLEQQARNDQANRAIQAQGQAIQGATFNANYLPDPNRPGQFMPRPSGPSVPSGYMPGPGGRVDPIPGTAPYLAGAQEKQVQSQLLTNLDNYIGMAEGGDWLLGGAKAQKADQLRNLVVQGVAAAQNPGRAPTDSDIQAAEMLVPKISDLNDRDKGARKAAQLRAEFLQRYKDTSSRYPSITEGSYQPPPPSGFTVK